MTENELTFNYRDKNFKDSILYVYNNDYINNHMGDPSLCKKYNKYGGFFNSWFKKFGLKARDNREKNLKYTCDSNYFEKIDTSVKAYWLGFLYADGYITKARSGSNRKVGISLAKIDRNLLELFLISLKSNSVINEYKVSSGYKVGAEYCRVIISDPKLASDLIKAGCVEQKTDVLKFPSEDIVPRYLQSHFIRGYFDGDGTIYKNTQGKAIGTFHVGFCGTDDMLNGIMDVFIRERIVDHRVKLEKRKSGQTVSSIRFGGNQITARILKFLYKNAIPMLQRKHDLYMELLFSNIYKEKKCNGIKKCCICGVEDAKKYYTWRIEDENYNKIFCSRHYQQLKKYGRITNIKFRYEKRGNCCEYCNNTDSRLIVVGNKHPKYKDKTVCKKHYDQICNLGFIKEEEEVLNDK